jgi:hypothetical protein
VNFVYEGNRLVCTLLIYKAKAKLESELKRASVYSDSAISFPSSLADIFFYSDNST